MKETMQSIHQAADAKPVVTGIIGTGAGFGTALWSYLDAATHVLTFVATLFGAITAVYTAIIVVRRYHKGYNDDKQNDIDKAK